MMFKDVHGLRHWKEEPDPVVELGRICYKGNGAHIYLPKRVCNRLKLDGEKDSYSDYSSAHCKYAFLDKGF